MGIRAAVPVAALIVAASASAHSAGPPRLREVVDRIGAYVSAYQQRISTIVAEEEYRQTIEDRSRIDAVTGRGHAETSKSSTLEIASFAFKNSL